MNLAILFPIALIVAIVLIVYYSRRRKAGGSGLGDRPDITEPPELRGSEQWKSRQAEAERQRQRDTTR